jgi:hypothetical protein
MGAFLLLSGDHRIGISGGGHRICANEVALGMTMPHAAIEVCRLRLTPSALQQAVDSVFEARIGDISGRGKLAADMREIWQMQPRFEKRTAASVPALLAQPRFRAGYDFLVLRAESGEGREIRLYVARSTDEPDEPNHAWRSRAGERQPSS